MAGVVCRRWSVSTITRIIIGSPLDIESVYSWLTQFCTLGYVQTLNFASTFLTLTTSVTTTLMESTTVCPVVSALLFLIEQVWADFYVRQYLNDHYVSSQIGYVEFNEICHCLVWNDLNSVHPVG
jgi:hypothetical protein